MLNFKLLFDKITRKEWLETTLSGKALLTIPQLNKGTAFTPDERHAFGLIGKLPLQVENLDEQVRRSYKQFQSYQTKLQQHIYLNNLHDKNQVLFYKLVSDHLVEMLPLIYTPFVGTAVKQFSHEFRQARGLYIAYPDQNYIDEILDNRTNPEVDIIVVTDGEGVLGIGDQGVGGMDIPIAKLMIYTLCGGINPTRTLPIQLDVGTNNQELLNDPFYLGWRHKRIQGQEYDDFIEKFITAVQRKFPHIFLHWEDFGRETARHNLDRFRHRICSFNDDIQGTGAVALAALLAAVQVNKSSLDQQRIVIFGAGTAGTGIADQIFAAMVREGLNAADASSKFWLIDRFGLITDEQTLLTDGQKPYARPVMETNGWTKSADNTISLLETIRQVKATVLIGCSSRAGAFSEEVIREMAKNTLHPIVFPLSNPTENCEAHPADILQWTDGNALVATGSPFEPVQIGNKNITISQCNNALVYPGIGLGIVAAKAKSLTDNMLWASCKALSECSPMRTDPSAPLLPPIAQGRTISRHIAIAVANAAMQDGVAQISTTAHASELVDEIMWQPHYVPYRKK